MLVRKGFDVELKQIHVHPDDRIKATPTRFDEPNGDYGWDVEVELVGRMETGYFEGIIMMESSYAGYPRRGLRVQADVTSSSSLSPQNLPFGIVKAKEPKTLKAVIEKTLGTGLTVAGFAAKDPQVAVTVATLVEGKRYELTVTLTPDGSAKDIRGTIEISLDEPGWVVLELPYSARLAD
jgi:hypothetical protein